MSTTFTATMAARLLALLGSMVESGPIPGLGPIPGIASMMAVALASIFAVAAVLKFKSPVATGSEFTDLRVPAPRLMARAIPSLELITALSLIASPIVGAMMAAVLLLSFTVVLVLTIRSGRTVSCGCLGAVNRQPVTVATVARNVVLLTMAGAAATTSSVTFPDLASVMVSITLGLVAMVMVQLLALRHELGSIWSVALAGDTGLAHITQKKEAAS